MQAGCFLGHVWGEIRYGMLLGNPASGRPMLFASDERKKRPILRFEICHIVLAFETQGKSCILQTRHEVPIHGRGGLY